MPKTDPILQHQNDYLPVPITCIPCNFLELCNLNHIMDFLSGKEKLTAEKYMGEAANAARNSTCFRSKCGTVIVKNNEIIGKGFNSPPLNECIDHCLKDDLPAKFKSDRNCCIHAEQRAIMGALQDNPGKIAGSRLYFIRLDDKGNIKYAGKPYCTICSKMTLDSGISEFVLWHDEGICVYGAGEYNTLSFQFQE